MCGSHRWFFLRHRYRFPVPTELSRQRARQACLRLLLPEPTISQPNENKSIRPPAREITLLMNWSSCKLSSNTKKPVGVSSRPAAKSSRSFAPWDISGLCFPTHLNQHALAMCLWMLRDVVMTWWLAQSQLSIKSISRCEAWSKLKAARIDQTILCRKVSLCETRLLDG